MAIATRFHPSHRTDFYHKSFTPKQLIQILNRGIANSQELGTSDSGTIWMGVKSDRIYAVENFG